MLYVHSSNEELKTIARNFISVNTSLFWKIVILFPYMSFCVICYANEIVQFPHFIWEASLPWQPCVTDGGPLITILYQLLQASGQMDLKLESTRK